MNIHPYSQGCDKWTVMGNANSVPQGYYYYFVRWPDGATECARIELINKIETGNVATNTITRTGRACAG
jgi:hypothetical protein